MAEIGTGVAETGQQAASDAAQVGTNAGSTSAVASAAVTTFTIGEDGKMSQGWREKFVPPELRGDKHLDSYGDNITNMVKSLAYYNKRMRDTGRGVPDESWSPTELETYHKMRGRPDKPDYGLKKPDFIPDDFYDPDKAKRFQEFAHKTGLTLKEVQALDEWNNEEVKQGIAALKQQQEAEKQQVVADAERILLEKCGTNLKTFQHLSDKFIEENTGNLEPAEKQKVIDAFHDPRIAPYLVPIFAQVYSKHFGEAKQADNVENVSRVLTPADALSKGKQMQANKAYADGSMATNDPAGYVEYQKQINELFRLAGT